MTLEDRIERLELENRRRRRTSLLLAICLAAVIGMTGAAAGSRSLEAEKILIKDASGQVRIFLGLGAEGPALEFHTPDQQSEISLHLGNAGPALVLSRTKEGKRSELATTRHLWGLQLTDANGTTRAKVSVSGSGSHIIQQNTIIR